MSHTTPTARRLGPVRGYTDSAEGPVYTVTGGDWEDVLGALGDEERITLNMGPQHPSTHGVLRMVLELEGETVKRNRPVVGYLHTGIEKNCEYRTWVQGDDVRHAHGLPVPAVQRDGLLAWRSRSCSASPTRCPSGRPSSE